MSQHAFVWCLAASLWLQACRSISPTLPDPGVTEIKLHRDGGCLGYYLPADSQSKGPVFLTGPCAGYTLILRPDGSAEYWGEENVPVIGHRSGAIDRRQFQHIARLMSELRFEDWPDLVAPRSAREGWSCVTFDGAPPLTISIVIRGQRKTIRHEQPGQEETGPEWLRLIEQKLEQIGETTVWR